MKNDVTIFDEFGTASENRGPVLAFELKTSLDDNSNREITAGELEENAGLLLCGPVLDEQKELCIKRRRCRA